MMAAAESSLSCHWYSACSARRRARRRGSNALNGALRDPLTIGNGLTQHHHLQGGQGDFPTLVFPRRIGSLQRLLSILRRQDAKSDRNTGIKSHLTQPARALGTDEIEMGGFTPDHCTKRDHCSKTAAFNKP